MIEKNEVIKMYEPTEKVINEAKKNVGLLAQKINIATVKNCITKIQEEILKNTGAIESLERVWNDVEGLQF